jgi:nucleoid-associated protein YgaU
MAPRHDLVGMQKDRNAQFMIAEVEEIMIPADKAQYFQDKVVEEKQEVESSVKVDTKEYVIQAGDTLWGIAKREYGDGNQWKRIYEFNKDAISNPNKPKKGQKIQIPIE